jgi:5-methylcytosine-specific restriction endonuclease McrA
MPKRVPYHRPVTLAASSVTYRRQPARAEDNRFYCSVPWRRLRAAFLAAHPLCADCRRQGRVTAASEVHHVKERRDHPDLALDWANLEALCRPCHNGRRARPRDPSTPVDVSAPKGGHIS